MLCILKCYCCIIVIIILAITLVLSLYTICYVYCCTKRATYCAGLRESPPVDVKGISLRLSREALAEHKLKYISSLYMLLGLINSCKKLFLAHVGPRRRVGPFAQGQCHLYGMCALKQLAAGEVAWANMSWTLELCSYVMGKPSRFCDRQLLWHSPWVIECTNQLIEAAANTALPAHLLGCLIVYLAKCLSHPIINTALQSHSCMCTIQLAEQQVPQHNFKVYYL